MADATARDGTPAALGTIAAALTLAATAPVAGDAAASGAETAVLGAAVVAAVAVAAFLSRRHGLSGRRVGAPLAGLGGVAVALACVYALNRGLTDALSIPLVGRVPLLLLATVGAAATVAAAAADYAGLSWRGIYRRAAATTVFSGVGAVGFVAMQAWMLVVLAVVVPLSGIGSVEELAATESVAVSQAGTVLGVGTVAAGYLVASGRGREFVDLRRPALRDLAYVVGGFVAVVVAATGLNALLAATGTESAGHSVVEEAERNPEMLLALVPAAILVIGPFEELLYRNVIQKSLYETFSRPGAVVAASVPFAVVHFPAYSGGTVGESLVSLGVVLALSLLLGAVYERTDNLLVPAVVHGLYNATVFLTLYLSLTG